MCVLATPREQRHLKKKIKDTNEPITRYSGMEQQAGADFRGRYESLAFVLRALKNDS